MTLATPYTRNHCNRLPGSELRRILHRDKAELHGFWSQEFQANATLNCANSMQFHNAVLVAPQRRLHFAHGSFRAGSGLVQTMCMQSALVSWGDSLIYRLNREDCRMSVCQIGSDWWHKLTHSFLSFFIPVCIRHSGRPLSPLSLFFQAPAQVPRVLQRLRWRTGAGLGMAWCGKEMKRQEFRII